jgi:hypothetical protein
MDSLIHFFNRTANSLMTSSQPRLYSTRRSATRLASALPRKRGYLINTTAAEVSLALAAPLDDLDDF